MRFFVNLKNKKFEVIGSQVEMPNSSDIFAVHVNNYDIWSAPYAVSHIDTGYRVGHGNSIDEAIEDGKKKMLSITSENFIARADKAKKENAVKELIILTDEELQSKG